MSGIVVGYLLEHDTLSLTPTLPADARKILLLFSGTNTNMLMMLWQNAGSQGDPLERRAIGGFPKVELCPFWFLH